MIAVCLLLSMVLRTPPRNANGVPFKTDRTRPITLVLEAIVYINYHALLNTQNQNRKLSEAPYKKTIDWSKWYIFWADERVVAKNHVDSNYKLAKDNLLSKLPIVPSHVYSINDSLTAEEAASEYEFVIRQLVKTRVVNVSDISDCPKFDLILLEVGADGHVASLFPNHPVLEEKNEWVTFIANAPKPPPERITLTLPVINSAANVIMVATGGVKAEAVRMAIDDMDPECSVLPARMIQPSVGKLVWFLDVEAASKLTMFS
ncbi:putative 6-phosphogluconolactonase [Helianthus annuus]|nr:putative 6-phosphogluconolactonase [Helianthus annuus]